MSDLREERPLRSRAAARGAGRGRRRVRRVDPHHTPREWLDQVRVGDAPERPRTRAECPTTRPCPWVGCRHHLALDVNEHGSLVLTDPGTPPWEMAETCALDVAERGGLILEDVGRLLNLTRERVRQVEQRALAKIRAAFEADDTEASARLAAAFGAEDDEAAADLAALIDCAVEDWRPETEQTAAPVEAAAPVEEQDVQITKNCEQCGDEFVTASKGREAEYCSSTCRKAAQQSRFAATVAVNEAAAAASNAGDAILIVLADGGWHTTRDIAARSGRGLSTVAMALRELDRAKVLERRCAGQGLPAEWRRAESASPEDAVQAVRQALSSGDWCGLDLLELRTGLSTRDLRAALRWLVTHDQAEQRKSDFGTLTFRMPEPPSAELAPPVEPEAPAAVEAASTEPPAAPAPVTVEVTRWTRATVVLEGPEDEVAALLAALDRLRRRAA